MGTIVLKRVYEAPEEHDGFRVLVDRLWPRGVKKESAKLDLWLKDIGPSTELRKWFNHEDEKWDEFKQRYLKELKANKETFQKLQAVVAEHKKTTLLFGARNTNHNQAVVLKEELEK